MAKINDFKVKEEDFNDLDIMSLPSRPSAAGMSATQLQERFDAGSKQVIRPKLNALIDLLNGTEGADNIGITPIEGLSGYTVQQILLAIKLLLDDKKNTEQSDREIAQKFDTAEAQALVKEISFSEGSGVFTITKYDGSVQTYDTALEKVALDVRLDGQQFVLTLADGSEQRVDLSAFITQTEVKSSDTITLSIENGAIVARITSGSVMLSHLNAEVTAYIDAKEAAAANSAAAAKLSEQNALNSANTAKASEQAAKTCQEQACSCATQAGLSRDAAKASEQAAKEYAQEAKDYSGGDFVTNTAFNQFKETVPTLDDGKVSVQQGGLYINSETTEEDKAEAQNRFAELGYKVKTYTSLSQIGLNPLTVTIEEIINALPVFSVLQTDISGSTVDNVSLYPTDAGVLTVHKTQPQRAKFEFISTSNGLTYDGIYAGSWYGWKQYLPLNGSVPMSGRNLYLNNGNGHIDMNHNAWWIHSKPTIGSFALARTLALYNANYRSDVTKALQFMSQDASSSQTTYNIFGEHNKPSGSYTGNGSATTREISVGGLAKGKNELLLIEAESSWSTFVTRNGAIAFPNKAGGSIKLFDSSECYLYKGTLKISTTHEALNTSGIEYNYEHK